MLVLTRRLDESLIIGRDIVITVVGVRGDKVRLAISAPRDLDISHDKTGRDARDDGGAGRCNS